MKKRCIHIAILVAFIVLSFILIHTGGKDSEFLNFDNNCYSYGGFYIASQEDWLYYNSGNADETLLRHHTGTRETEVLVEEPTGQYYFYQGRLFYYNESEIIAWDPKREDAETIYTTSGGILSYFPYHGKLYCSDFEKSFTVDINSGIREEIDVDLTAYQCAVMDDALYMLYTRGNDRYLARYHEDTGEMETIDSGLLNQLTNTNNRLYYVRNQIVDGQECFESWYCYENGEISAVDIYPSHAIGATRDALILEDLETEGDVWLWNGESLIQVEIPSEHQKKYNEVIYMATEEYLVSVHVNVDSWQISNAEVFGIPLEPLA